MGQYYKFINLDKKEVCQRNWYCIKLTEHSYLRNKYCNDTLNLLSDRWKGDRILHIGDYACGSDETTTEKLIFSIEKDYNLKISIFDWSETFQEVKPKEYNHNRRIKYVYNHDKKEFIDLTKQPIQWFDITGDEIHGVKMNSFALLTGCGNGLGGGDYYGVNHDKIGCWAGDHFESSCIPLERFKHYKENTIIFNECLEMNNNIKNWSSKAEDVISAIETKMLNDYISGLKKEKDININNLYLDNADLTSSEKFLLGLELIYVKNLDKKEKEAEICI